MKNIKQMEDQDFTAEYYIVAQITQQLRVSAIVYKNFNLISSNFQFLK